MTYPSKTLVTADESEQAVNRSTAVCHPAVSQSVFEAIENHQLDEWDAFVEEHPWGGLFHTSSWRRAIECAFPHIQGTFVVLRDPVAGRIVAGLPVYRVRSWLLGTRLVSVPFATYCDPLVSCPTELDQLIAAARSIVSGELTLHLQIRTCKSTRFLNHPTTRTTSDFCHHYLALETSANELWQQFSRTAIRRPIRHAEAIMFRPADSPRDVLIFHRLLTESRRRLALPALPTRFFQALHDSFYPHALRLVVAQVGGRPVAGALAIAHRDVCHLEYAGELSGVRRSGVTQALYWHLIQQAIIEGRRTFSFGRTDLTNAGLLAFKRHWRPIEERITHWEFGAQARVAEAYARNSQSRSLARTILRFVPKPLYELAGAFVYRHWG